MELVTIQDLRERHLRAYTVETIRGWARAGTIPSVRVGRKYLFDPAEVIAALKQYQGKAVQP